MASYRRDIGTITLFKGKTCPLYETVQERYRICGLLNIIQHIDIYGKSRVSYVEKNSLRMRGSQCQSSVSSVASSARKFSKIDTPAAGPGDPKLSTFSVTTKVSGLWPGHDILSKKNRRFRLV